MPARTVSPGSARSNGLKHGSASTGVLNTLSFTVQDRRLNTRLLNETQRRKAQLFGMTRHDVAHQLHRYNVQPSLVMDEGRRDGPRVGKSASHNRSTTATSKAASGAVADAIGASSSPSDNHSTAVASSSFGRDAHSRWQAQGAYPLHKKEDTVYARVSTSTSPDEHDEEVGSVLPVPPTGLYEEWLSAGCPTGPWSALLQEMYGLLEAERAFLTTKYNPKVRPQP
ncbi:conserved hypothetical protein [Leishmania braziliensis MHOM/BR/75/M2904]|uniref:Uncharacterized protein n=2 Tax=Leishmania braziliensis TaxID=5660 RepID=A4HH80_LEIBR|nr:conserved hypothetical protein [Leishmania braziliensis MHOM/BR/75/M2904]CAJ2476398.1 unnamed protein product [Leishmania braziliensis]CAJ2476853.1 unnamed protein product [Leishmania braziliensis]CAM39931.1 conserved hypothetical protein [Leishmania braziliensis MHOM/BR/75/M2904]SYZ67593.1 hypothetical_protein [Leishmania braziliensis MHOM/BR/75/M2904]